MKNSLFEGIVRMVAATALNEASYDEPHRYIGWFYEYNADGDEVDSFKEWCDAYSDDEARRELESRCGRRVRLEGMRDETRRRDVF